MTLKQLFDSVIQTCAVKRRAIKCQIQARVLLLSSGLRFYFKVLKLLLILIV